MPCTLWKVIINGKDIGIIESNYTFAKSYWDERARCTGYRIKLEEYLNETSRN